MEASRVESGGKPSGRRREERQDLEGLWSTRAEPVRS